LRIAVTLGLRTAMTLGLRIAVALRVLGNKVQVQSDLQWHPASWPPLTCSRGIAALFPSSEGAGLRQLRPLLGL
jgi:hypothetical protein